MDDFDPTADGPTHGEDGRAPGSVAAAGRGTVLLPVSVRRLEGEALEVAHGLQVVAAEISALQGRLAEGVARGRQVGLSWSVVGWSVGTTGEAARQRWGSVAA